MIKQKSKTKFLENFSNKCNTVILSSFYNECINLKKNPKTELEIIITWLSKFYNDINDLSSFDLVDFLLKRNDRIQRLKNSGKHQSIIDKSLFEIYAPSEESANKTFDEYVKSKTRNSFLDNQNNKFGSKDFYLKKHGSLDGYRTSSSSYTTRLEYWIKQGFTFEEAQIKLKERQTTFSLKKCIEKYR